MVVFIMEGGALCLLVCLGHQLPISSHPSLSFAFIMCFSPVTSSQQLPSAAVTCSWLPAPCLLCSSSSSSPLCVWLSPRMTVDRAYRSYRLRLLMALYQSSFGSLCILLFIQTLWYRPFTTFLLQVPLPPPRVLFILLVLHLITLSVKTDTLVDLGTISPNYRGLESVHLVNKSRARVPLAP